MEVIRIAINGSSRWWDSSGACIYGTEKKMGRATRLAGLENRCDSGSLWVMIDAF